MKRLKLKDKDKLLSQGYQEIINQEMVVDIIGNHMRKSCTKKIIMLFNDQIKEMKFLKFEITTTTNVKKEELFEMTLEEIQTSLEKESPIFNEIKKIEQYINLDQNLVLNSENNKKIKL